MLPSPSSAVRPCLGATYPATTGSGVAYGPMQLLVSLRCAGHRPPPMCSSISHIFLCRRPGGWTQTATLSVTRGDRIRSIRRFKCEHSSGGNKRVHRLRHADTQDPVSLTLQACRACIGRRAGRRGLSQTGESNSGAAGAGPAGPAAVMRRSTVAARPSPGIPFLPGPGHGHRW
jgi:hypothetical protein